MFPTVLKGGNPHDLTSPGQFPTVLRGVLKYEWLNRGPHMPVCSAAFELGPKVAILKRILSPFLPLKIDNCLWTFFEHMLSCRNWNPLKKVYSENSVAATDDELVAVVVLCCRQYLCWLVNQVEVVVLSWEVSGWVREGREIGDIRVSSKRETPHGKQICGERASSNDFESTSEMCWKFDNACSMLMNINREWDKELQKCDCKWLYEERKLKCKLFLLGDMENWPFSFNSTHSALKWILKMWLSQQMRFLILDYSGNSCDVSYDLIWGTVPSSFLPLLFLLTSSLSLSLSFLPFSLTS